MINGRTGTAYRLCAAIASILGACSAAFGVTIDLQISPASTVITFSDPDGLEDIDAASFSFKLKKQTQQNYVEFGPWLLQRIGSPWVILNIIDPQSATLTLFVDLTQYQLLTSVCDASLTCDSDQYNTCADGNIDPGEECDDGDIVGGAGSSSTCTHHVADTNGIHAALDIANAGDIILLAPGTYDDLLISSHDFPPSHVAIRSQYPACPAIIGLINVNQSSFLRFEYLDLHHPMRQGEYSWTYIFDIQDSHDIEALNSFVHGSADGDFLNDVSGLSAYNSADVRVEGNEFKDLHRGSLIGVSRDVVVRNNFYHDIQVDHSDYADDLSNILVEGNLLTNIRTDGVSHVDAIQFFNDNGTVALDNVTIKDNVIIKGNGDWSQSIFIQSNQAAGILNTNFYIYGNIVYNGHTHGISIADTDGVEVHNNTVLEDPTGSNSAPTINTYSTVDANIYDNVAAGYTDSGTNTQYDNNITAQNADPSLDTHYDRLFLNANAGPSATREDFLPRPDGILIQPGRDIGALEFEATDLTAVILTDVSSGAEPLTVNLDGSVSADPDQKIVSWDWDCDDGQQDSGASVTHTFTTQDTYNVTLTVTNDIGEQDTANKTIIVLAPPIVGLVLGLNLDGNLIDFSESQLTSNWVGTENYGDGLRGQAIDLDGTATGPYVTTPHDDILEGMSELTLAFFARKTDADIGGHGLLKHTIYRFMINDDDISTYLFNDVGTRFDLAATSSAIQDTNWHHYALTYDGAMVNLYIDGVLINSGSFTGNIATDPTRYLDIGKDPWGSSFSGSIDEVQVYNIALTQADIAAGMSLMLLKRR